MNLSALAPTGQVLQRRRLNSKSVSYSPAKLRINSKIDTFMIFYYALTDFFRNLAPMKMTRIITMIGLVLLPMAASAKSAIEKYHEEIAELSVDANLASPDVPKKHVDEVKTRMADLMARLKKSGFDADAKERDGLVVAVTIPVSELFLANDTLIAPHGVKPLMAISRHLKAPDYYKVLVTVHSDDTGSEEYLNRLTRARADNIVGWFEKQGLQTEGIVPYGMGFDEPVSVDPTRAARALNRRIEIYFVPGPQMINNIKAGR